MKYEFFYFLLLFGFNGISQVNLDEPDNYSSNIYPEGIYHTYKSFLNKTPSSTKTVEARNIFKPKQRINDPLIDNCYFNYKRPNKRVKDAFAISYNGSLYIHIKSLQKFMDNKDRKQKIDYKDSFLRVIDQGQYLYMEGYVRKGGGIGFGIGSGPISIGTGGPTEHLKGIIFDFDREVFDLFRDCKDFNEFLNSGRPDKSFKCHKKSIPLQIIRDVIFDINDGI